LARGLPLNALRAFEAAARSESFIGAAAELGVTQAAISKQVRQLEERLGLELFFRSANGVDLTQAGYRLFSSVSPAFTQLRTAAESVAPPRAERMIRLVVPPNFAINWLIPRLTDFRDRHPDASLRVASVDRGAINWNSTDLAIYYGQGPSGVSLRPLFRSAIVALASRSLARTIDQPADLIAQLHLEVSGAPKDWETWLARHRLRAPPDWRSYLFDSYALALKAVELGLGVAIGRYPLISDPIERNGLVPLFEPIPDPGFGWYIGYPLGRRLSALQQAFLRWIAGRAAETVRDLAQRRGVRI